VYVSDMKKVFTWYNLLLEKDMLEFTDDDEEKDETDDENPEEKATDETTSEKEE